MPMAYFDSILVTRLTVDKNRENGGLVFQPFLDFRVEIFTEDGHFLAISVFIIVTGLKPQNKKQLPSFHRFLGNCNRFLGNPITMLMTNKCNKK